MSNNGVGRRDLLRSVAAAALLAGGGCLSSSGDSTARFADLAPADEDGLVFANLTVELTEETGDSTGLAPVLLPIQSGGNEQPVELPDQQLAERGEPLLSFPFRLGGQLLAGASLRFYTVGLRQLVTRGPGNTVDGLFTVDRTVVGTGEFDPDALGEGLGTQTAVDYLPVDGSAEGIQFYERADDAVPAASVIGVSEERVVIGPDRERLRRILEVARGERGRAVEELDGFEWLTETAGNGTLVAGWHGPVDLTGLLAGDEGSAVDELFTQADNVLVGATLNPDAGELTVDLAIQSDSLSADRRERIESTFGVANGDSSVSPDGRRLSISRTFGDVPFEPLSADPTDDLPSGDDLPAKVAEAVPDGAIEISKAPDEEGAYNLRPLTEIPVDELRVRAIGSGWETTITGSGLPERLTVYPNPDGDEIRIIATVDDVSGVVAAVEIPSDTVRVP